MKRYEVNYKDPVTGAISPIDTITAPDDYTAADYVKDCRENADTDYADMIAAGEIILVAID